MRFGCGKADDGDGVRIAVLDTGIDKRVFPRDGQTMEEGIGIYISDDQTVHVTQDSDDDIGHGTAVCSILRRGLPRAVIIPIKLIYEGMMAHEDALIYALNYIAENIRCDIVHISIGLRFCDDMESLHSACERLRSQNVIMVAAFDNGGSLSYPAAFDCVIGVDGARLSDGRDYVRTDDEAVNFIVNSREMRVRWLNHATQMVSGNSFLAPELTAVVARLVQSGVKTYDAILDALNGAAAGQAKFDKTGAVPIPFEIRRAVAFPFNKEIHALARFRSDLSFEIVGFFDSKYSGNVNKRIDEILRRNEIDDQARVQDIAKLNWLDDFDTVILGHTELLCDASRHDYLSDMIKMCVKHKKRLYSFSDISARLSAEDRGLVLYTPRVEEISPYRLKKPYCIGKPVLGVVGTASAQGKFTLQIRLRLELMKMGYRVGFLGTEPSAPLFGADAVYPMGYEGTVKPKGLMSVYAVNQLLGDIERKRPDIILFGSQSQTIPNDSGGLKQYPVVQNELLMACQADAYVLCVSCEDSDDYVQRTVSYLEAIYPSRVICLALSPLKSSLRWSVLSNKREKVGREEIERARDRLRRVNLPVYDWDDEAQFEALTQACVGFFS